MRIYLNKRPLTRSRMVNNNIFKGQTIEDDIRAMISNGEDYSNGKVVLLYGAEARIDSDVRTDKWAVAQNARDYQSRRNALTIDRKNVEKKSETETGETGTE